MDDARLADRVRRWTNQATDENSIHVVGNGRIHALSAGPNVDCLFGPPYTSPNILQLTTRCARPATGAARRELGTAIWQHEILVEGKPALAFTEFAPVTATAYVRRFTCTEAGLEWALTPHAQGGFHAAPGMPGVFLQRLKPGTLIFRDAYITDQPACHWVIPQGDCEAQLAENGDLVVRLLPGEGSLSIVGAVEYGNGVAEAEALLADGVDALLAPTRAHWQAFTVRRLRAKPELARIPAEAAEDLDAVATTMKAQQSVQGPATIGWHSPMAYIRDLYGGARGMLALGMYEEARQSLEFRRRKFEYFGDLRTAEFIGTDCSRHTYNDDVEGPAYLMLQARDYLQATGDTATVRGLWPMLQWCWKVQQRQLVRGLLPFNGDETYVAGGLFPMEGLCQGSADTTLAFIVAGEWLIDWAEGEQFITYAEAEAQRRIIAESRRAWRKWFAAGDRIWANAPEREGWVEPPRFRRLAGMWLERDPNSGHYVLPEDLGKPRPKAESPERMTLNSVSLLPAFLHAAILTAEESRAIVDRILASARPNGVIPTCNEEDCAPALLDRVVVAWDGGHSRIGDRIVGYDPGLLLTALVALDHPAAAGAYERMMSMLDQAGSWDEYYDGEDRPLRAGIRANIWAGGINTEAAVTYLLGKQH